MDGYSYNDAYNWWLMIVDRGLILMLVFMGIVTVASNGWLIMVQWGGQCWPTMMVDGYGDGGDGEKKKRWLIGGELMAKQWCETIDGLKNDG